MDNEQLHQRICAYCEAHGLALSRFGVMVKNDPNLVFEIAKGRDLRASTIRQIEAALASEPRGAA